MIWNKIEILNDEGISVEAQAPIIISASRSTDIPSFYSDWFVNRWEKGYIRWKNPFNNTLSYVSFKEVRCVVFWTKNPRPMLKHINFLNENIKNYYFQYSLNDYDEENYERNIPTLESRIETFKELSDKIGKERVIWRFDPLLLTDKIDCVELLRRIENIGDQLHKHTNKLVTSFADIGTYKRVDANLKREKINFEEFTNETMIEIATGLSELNKKWGLEIATCSEKIDLSEFGIKKNRCVDDDLMIDNFSNDKKLMDFLGVTLSQDIFTDEVGVVEKSKNLKDRGQRLECGCVFSKDIGQYNTCANGCVYCYANISNKSALRNYKLSNTDSDTIV